MRVIPGNAQDIGDRANQEDSFGFSSLRDPAFERHGGVMMVLCDGMGGLADGAVASRVAVDAALRGYTRKSPSEDIPSALYRIVHETHDAVRAAFGDGESGGSTIVIAVVCADLLYWASLGDSRLYLFRHDAPALQLTVDHSVANLEQRAARGERPPNETLSSANPEALTGYLGSPYPPQPDANRDGLPLRPGDRIVACSDGVYRGLSPEAMAAIALRDRPMGAAEKMVKSVLEQQIPHQDNLTVLLFEVSRQGRLAGFAAMRGPAVPVVLYGAVGGIAAAIISVLIIIGVMHLRSDHQPAVDSEDTHSSVGDSVAGTRDGDPATHPATAPRTPADERVTSPKTVPSVLFQSSQPRPPSTHPPPASAGVEGSTK